MPILGLGSPTNATAMLRSRRQIPLLRRPLNSTRRALLQMRVPDSLRGPRLDAALATLDPFSAKDVLLKACPVFRSPPPFCKAPLRKALSFALELVRDASHTPDSLGCERAWKLLLFIPRMLLWRPVGVVRVPKADLLARFQAFFHREWELLLKRAREEGAAVGHQSVATCLASAISSRTRLKSHLSPAACPEGPCRWICGFRPPPCCSHCP